MIATKFVVISIMAVLIVTSSFLTMSLTSNQTIYAKKSDKGNNNGDNKGNPSTGDNNVNPPSEQQTNPSPPPTDDKKKDEPKRGVCVVGVDSPCNGPGFGKNNCINTPERCPPLPIVCP